MERSITRHPHAAGTPLCRCTRCQRDRVVLSALSPQLARVLRQAISAR
ncbi:MAG TPA: hypothetical protein VM070_08110 [Candidatus Saccharimonadales bacterium]|nr:hypothetical protein [Candidatus Saccharimonadales bacterium]